MSDAKKPRAPRGRRRTPASGTAATKPDEATPKPAAQLSERRRRIYKIPVLGTIAYIVWPPRTQKAGKVRRALSWTAALVAVLGIGMAAYPVAGESYPFFYKIPVEKLIEWSNVLSDLQTNRLQDSLEKEFLACGKKLCTGEGDPLTRIEIPSLGVNTLVVQGTSADALRAGAGHYPNTPLPGEKGNVGIAGHRTTYGRPFNSIDAMKKGDKVILTTPLGRYTYEVSRAPWITTPYDWGVIGRSSDPLLTLTTCHPKGSARERLIVRAELVKTESLRQAA